MHNFLILFHGGFPAAEMLSNRRIVVLEIFRSDKWLSHLPGVVTGEKDSPQHGKFSGRKLSPRMPSTYGKAQDLSYAIFNNALLPDIWLSDPFLCLQGTVVSFVHDRIIGIHDDLIYSISLLTTSKPFILQFVC
jgi:hypothetical protein